jgi:hypothetical protein
VQVGDLVRHFLTEQIGVILVSAFRAGDHTSRSYQILWTTQGLSLFGPGSTEWCGEQSLEVLNESR